MLTFPYVVGVEVLTKEGTTGFKSAAGEEVLASVAVMDLSHVVRLIGEALDRCWHRVRQVIRGVLPAFGRSILRAQLG